MAKADPPKPRFRVSLTSIQELGDFARNTRSECIFANLTKAQSFPDRETGYEKFAAKQVQNPGNRISLIFRLIFEIKVQLIKS